MAVCMTCGWVFADRSTACPACGDTRFAAVITPPTPPGTPVTGVAAAGARPLTWPVRLPNVRLPRSPGRGSGRRGRAARPTASECAAETALDCAAQTAPAGATAQTAAVEPPVGTSIAERAAESADVEGVSEATFAASPLRAQAGGEQAPRRAEIMAARRREARLYNRGLRWMREHAHPPDDVTAGAATLTATAAEAPGAEVTGGAAPGACETVAALSIEPLEDAAASPIPALEDAAAPPVTEPFASAPLTALEIDAVLAQLAPAPASVIPLSAARLRRACRHGARHADTAPVRETQRAFALGSRPRWSDAGTTRLVWLVVLGIVVTVAYLAYSHGGFVPLLARADQAIHDLGDLAFSWAPTPWQYAAGSILQVAIPLLFAVYFWWRQERVGLVLTLTWTGESVYGVSAYAGDAVRMALPFYVNDGSGRPHDWHELLARLNVLQYTEQIAWSLAGIAATFLAAALVAAVVGCLRPPERLQRSRRRQPRQASFGLEGRSQKNAA